MKSYFAEHLTVETERAEATVTYLLSGFGEDETLAKLDVLTAAVVAESARQQTARPDNARATVLGERKEDGEVRFARLVADETIATTEASFMPGLSSERLQDAGMVFGALFAGLGGVILLVYVRLVKAKRVFDEDNPLLQVDAHIDPDDEIKRAAIG